MNQIDEILAWFKENHTASNIVKFNQKLNELGLLNVTLAEDLGKAFAVFTKGEQNYDILKNKRFIELRTGPTKVSIESAWAQVTVELEDVSETVTNAKVLYTQLKYKQTAVVVVIETFKQYVSSLKKEREL